MYQLYITQVLPPPAEEQGAFVLLFEGTEPEQRIIVGVQGHWAEGWKSPIIIQLPGRVETVPTAVANIPGCVYDYEVLPAKEPYTLLWPEDVVRAEYKLGTLPLRLYFGEEPPALKGALARKS